MSKQNIAEVNQRDILCENLSFAASEAYKLLRANLKFALKSESGCPVVGVTSSTSGEGKTTTSINLAYTLAQTGKNVLLIDGDMRLPNVARALKVGRRPGLSDCIVGSAHLAECIRKSEIIDNWDIIPAGVIPPNPSELLSSEGMGNFLKLVKARYDFIVIDLPPVGIVSDAIVVTEFTDGLMVVVREDYATKRLLARTMTYIEPLKEKMLGFVMTDVISEGKGYSYRRSRKNNKYGKYYYEGYGYERSNTAVKDAKEKVNKEGVKSRRRTN